MFLIYCEILNFIYKFCLFFLECFQNSTNYIDECYFTLYHMSYAYHMEHRNLLEETHNFTFRNHKKNRQFWNPTNVFFFCVSETIFYFNFSWCCCCFYRLHARVFLLTTALWLIIFIISNYKGQQEERKQQPQSTAAAHWVIIQRYPWGHIRFALNQLMTIVLGNEQSVNIHTCFLYILSKETRVRGPKERKKEGGRWNHRA